MSNEFLLIVLTILVMSGYQFSFSAHFEPRARSARERKKRSKERS